MFFIFSFFCVIVTKLLNSFSASTKHWAAGPLFQFAHMTYIQSLLNVAKLSQSFSHDCLPLQGVGKLNLSSFFFFVFIN